MPVRPLRRLDLSATVSLHDRISRESLHYAWSRSEVDDIEREHPNLVIERNGNLLAAFGEGRASLAYAYVSDGAFSDAFPSMLTQLLPKIRRELRADSVRFRLAHGPSRPAVEPVLRKLLFSAEKPWLCFSLSRETALPKLTALKGVQFRDGDVDDVEALIRIDRDAFPDMPLPTPIMRANIERGERVLLATVLGEPVGMALYLETDPGEGYLHTVAVLREHHRKGIGAALTARAAKRLFADGAQRVDLRTDDDNSDAIRLYRSLGFQHVSSGRDYRRPTDEREIARIQKASESTMIRFGGWR